MACRVGISTDPDARIRHWKTVEGHTYSRILHTGKTYDRANELEAQEARDRSCTASGGGKSGE